MKMHKVILDISVRLVHLNTPVYGKVTLHLPVISRIKTSLHHVVERKVEEIHVVKEFPDVFLDDQSKMPPKKAIEFEGPRRRPEGVMNESLINFFHKNPT
jgi:hypothetical protein